MNEYKDIQEDLGSCQKATEGSVLLNDDTYYAITICPSTMAEVRYYNDFLALIKERFKKFNVLQLVWELNKLNVLHCHLLASGSKKIYYKGIRKYSWNIDIRVLKSQDDKFRWENYLQKNAHDDVLLRHVSMHQNLFDY